MKSVKKIAHSLKEALCIEQKEEILSSFLSVREGWEMFVEPAQRVALLAVEGIGQSENVLGGRGKKLSIEQKRALVDHLVAIDHFYEAIGGIVGYQAFVLDFLMGPQTDEVEKASNLVAPMIDVAVGAARREERILSGILSLPEQAELYPVGGLGTRLGLTAKNGESLPAATLPLGGCSLLEGLIRDVQAREYCYFKLFGAQVTIPIALMTSHEMHNTQHITNLCEKCHWFGRPKESMLFFSQLLVPVVTAKGDWVMEAPGVLHVQPGGHGVIWRTAQEKGVFDWFQSFGKKHLIVRQINNPVGGVEGGLLALVGVGKETQKPLGFAACDRLPDAAEGVLVMKKFGENSVLTNIEYTEFEKEGIDSSAEYPANTNLLYVNLEKISPVLEKTPLPKLILNMKQDVTYLSPEGKKSQILGGRLESMMQNISDTLVGKELPTFLTHNKRTHTISTTKRIYDPQKTLLETPEGVFYDILQNNHHLLKDVCGWDIASFMQADEYLEKGPSHLFLYHPALGPLYSVISQKLRSGRFSHGSELQLEIADIFIEELDLSGSFVVRAKTPLGSLSDGVIRYSEQNGKCVLRNVTVRNAGVQWASQKQLWKNTFKRQECLQIILEGHSEFLAENVVFEGNETFIVPDGERWIVESENGQIKLSKSAPDLEWPYRVEGSDLLVEPVLDSIFCRAS